MRTRPRIDSRAVASGEAIPIIGGTGALGYGLALRWARAGQAVVIGSRSAERAAETARKLSELAPDAEIEGLGNDQAAKQGRSSSSRSRSAPSRRTSTTCARRSSPASCWSTAPSRSRPRSAARRPGSLGVWQGSAAQQAQEMVPEGVTVVAALHTVSAPILADLAAELDEDVLLCGDRKADKAQGRRADRGDRRAARGQRRARSRWRGSSSS